MSATIVARIGIRRAISLGEDAQSAVEMIYLPAASHKDKEIYGQVESQVKRVYGARIGWMGWDIYDSANCFRRSRWRLFFERRSNPRSRHI